MLEAPRMTITTVDLKVRPCMDGSATGGPEDGSLHGLRH
jgi:hypothetical protein